MIFIIPGLSWSFYILKDKARLKGLLIFTVFLLSSLINALILAAFKLTGIHITPLLHTACLILFTNAGIGVLWAKGGFFRTDHNPAKIGVILLIALTFYFSLYYFVSSKFIYNEDSDAEKMSMAYGLVYHLKPQTVTDRATCYYFAHPALPDLYAAQHLLLSGDIENLKFCYDYSLKWQKESSKRPQDTYEITREIYQKQKEKCLEYAPAYCPKFKSAAIFIGIAAFLMLYLTAYRFTGSSLVSLLAALYYISINEIYLRTSLGELNTNLAIFFLIYMLNSKGSLGRLKNPAMFLSGMFAYLINNQIIFFISAIFTVEFIDTLFLKKKGLFNSFKAALANKMFLGFFSGMFLYCGWGILIDARQFLQDHFCYHIINRIFHIQDIAGCPEDYPGIASLFIYFIKNTNPVITLPALSYSIFIIYRYLRKKSPDKNIKIYSLATLIGLIAFHIVDWRQSKRLMFILPTLIFCYLNFCLSLKKPWKKAVPIISFTAVIILHIISLWGIFQNPSSFYPLGHW